MSSRNFFVTSLWAVILFVSLAQSAVVDNLFATEDETFFCQKPPKDPSPAPTVKFPDIFSVAIEAVYSVNQENPRISDVIESVDQKLSLSSISRFENGTGYQYIFNRTAKTFAFVNDATTCVDALPLPIQTSAGMQNDPLLFPENVTAGWFKNVSSIMDIWNWAISNAKEIYKDEKEHSKHEHGIPIDHYYVCKQGANGYVFEIEICVTQAGAILPSPGVSGSLPVRIDVKRFNNNTAPNATTTEEFVGYRLSNYKVVLEKEAETFMPPPGVPCINVSTTQGRPVLPDIAECFSVHVDYFDYAERMVSSNELHVDLKKNYVAFQYSNNDTGLPMQSYPGLQRGKIIHDFNSGIEYVLDTTKETCVNVSDIPLDAGDVALDEKDRSVGIKNARELLGVHLENAAALYYVGVRMLGGDLPADVWIAYKQENGNASAQNLTTVHEMYFTRPDWTEHSGVGNPPSPTLLAVKIYEYHFLHPHQTKVTPIVKTLQFHDFVLHGKISTPLKYFDVMPCLNISKNDSYLVAFGSDSMMNLDKVGRGRVENSSRITIADTAGVSPLRVTNFYFEAVNETFWVFFFIADRPTVNGTKTKWHTKDLISAKDARTKLNSSIEANALSVSVPLEDGKSYNFALNKSSLAAVPPYFSTPIIQNIIKQGGGYTGGSMAALGICMLLIGGVLGMVLAFFMWKRNREGGGAPVYYSNKSSA